MGGLYENLAVMQNSRQAGQLIIPASGTKSVLNRVCGIEWSLFQKTIEMIEPK